MNLYIVRHGQTDWNLAGKLQGTTNTKLNEKGRNDAMTLGNRMVDVPLDVIFSSPLNRAFETANLIKGDRAIDVIKDDRLKEISFGDMEGIEYTIWDSKESPYHYFFTEPDKYTPPPNGETLESLCARTKDFIVNVIETMPMDSNIMIVAHGALNKGIMCYLEDNDLSHFWGERLQKNCEADKFTFCDGQWTKDNL